MRSNLQCSRHIVVILVVLFALVLPLHGADGPTLRLFGGYGLRSTSPTVVISPSGAPDTTAFPSTLITALDIGLGVRYPLTSVFGIRGDVSYTFSRGDLQARRSIVVAVDGRPIEGSIRHDAAVQVDHLNIDAGFTVGLHRSLSVDAVVGFVIPTPSDADITQVLESPPGMTFLDGGSKSRTFSNVTTAGAQAYAVFGLDIRTRLNVFNNIDLEPSLGARLSITPADNYAWRPTKISLGLALAYTPERIVAPLQQPRTDFLPDPEPNLVPVQQPPRTKIVITTTDTDTVTIVDPWIQGRRDTIYRQRSHQHADTVRGVDVDTIYLREHVTLEQHLPGAPPFLSSIVRVDVPATVIDTAADVLVHVNVVSDTLCTTLVEVWHNDSVVHQRTLSLGSGVVMFRLADVVSDVTRRNHIMLRVTARTTDAVGQTIDAAPRIITLRRSGGRRLRSQ